MSNDRNKGVLERLDSFKTRGLGALAILAAVVAAVKEWNNHRVIVLSCAIGLVAIAACVSLWHVVKARKPRTFNKPPEYRFSLTKRRAGIFGLFAIPITCLVVALRLIFPPDKITPLPPLDCSRLTVAIAGLSPASKSADAQAEELTNTLKAELEKLSIRVPTPRPSADFKDKGLEEKVRAAIQVGVEQGAQLVLFGEMEARGAQVTVIRCQTCVNAGDNREARLTAVSTAEPNALRFSVQIEGPERAGNLAQQTAAIAKFCWGLWQYEQGRLEEASNVLRDSEDRAAIVINGLISWRRSLHAEKPRDDLKSALGEFGQILGTDFNEEPGDEIDAYACVGAGNAFCEMSEYEPESADTHFTSAERLFKRALTYFKRRPEYELLSRAIRTGATNGLALTMIGKAHRAAPAVKLALLRDAEPLLNEELQRLVSESQTESRTSVDNIKRNDTNRRILESNFASLLVELSRMEDDRGDKLRKAKELYHDVVNFMDRNSAPYEWAVVQANLGNVYTELAIDSSINQALGDLRYAEAHYLAAAEVFTANAYPLQWAQNQTDLSRVWVESARRKEGEEAADLLNRAVANCETARRAMGSASPDWALATRYLASAKRELGNKENDPDRRLSHFNEAISLLRDGSLTTLDPRRDPFEWPASKKELGDSLSACGLALSGREREQHLRWAIAAYRDALGLWESQTSAYDYRKTREALDRAEAAL